MLSLKSVSQSAIYRNPLQVSPILVARLDDVHLNELMGHLLPAQAYRCRCPDAYANANVDARDKGCDGWNARPAEADRWLGETETCWQFKAGRAGEPARLTGEVDKPIPRRTLEQGGRFVLVASGSGAGRRGVEDRLNALIDDANRAGLPSDKIAVYGSEHLARWCNQHPAVASRLTGARTGMWTFDRWERSDEHRIQYQASPKLASDLSMARSQIDYQADSDSNSVLHLHVQGQPGVGKTRFALELCREAPWRESVIYVRQAEDVRLAELIDDAAESPDIRLVVVADEAQPGRLEPLRESVGLADGRVRLITIGTSHTPDSSRISQISIEPLDPAAMRAVVNDWYPDMPWEHVNFVTEFAAGYMKLGRLTADAVSNEPSTTLPNLLARHEIRRVLDRLLGEGNRRALYVVAVLTRVGWTEDKQQEGQAIADHLDLNWHEVLYQVKEFHDSMGIAPRGGRYRYISPEPLAIYLAHEAWETYADQLKSLPESLPSESSKEAYYKRLESLASNPRASEYSRDQLQRFFFRIDDFVDAHAVRRWSALSASDPELAARSICQALAASSADDRRKISFAAVAVLVSRLARIASRSAGFHDAATALALLAEPENDTWRNGASREFLAKYHVSLGATALPYLERLIVLDELLRLRRTKLDRLVVGALGQVGNDSAGGVVMPASDQAPEPDWEPSSAELLDCVTAGIDRLRTIAAARDPELRADLFAAAKRVSWLLRYRDAGSSVATLFIELSEAWSELREPLRKQIAKVLRRDRENMPPEQRKHLDGLHARFEDPSLEGQVQQYVGPHEWERERTPDLVPLAAQLIEIPGVLTKEWNWLTSGQAGAAWELGEALAAADAAGRLADELPRLPGGGPDYRIVCGYIAAKRQILGDEWYERWAVSQFEREPQPIALLFEVMSRSGATDRLTRRTAQLVRSRAVAGAIVGRLKYADWTGISDAALQLLLQAMLESGHRETVVCILQHRIESSASDARRWQSLAMKLVLDLGLIRCREMPNHYWFKLATILVPDHPREISAAIFRAHAKRDRFESWMLRYEKEVVKVLLYCVVQAPSEVWEELRSYLWPVQEAMLFVIGFPTEVLERFPRSDVLKWIAECPGEQATQRAALLTPLTNKKSMSDDSLGARIIAQYGDDKMVRDAFLSHHVSGTFTGPGSHRYRELADTFSDIAKRTALPGLRSWANGSASVLSKMADQERLEEEEDALLLR